MYIMVRDKGDNMNKINKNLSNEIGKKGAFTLAEVLIVLSIIGLVAVLALPSFLSELTERIYSNRQANIAQKVTKAVELMIVNGDYENFETTDEFVDKFQKYMKISKRCDSNNLTKCWPSATVSLSDGSKYNVSDARTGSDLHTKSEANNVGLVLNDGASLILTYDPEASIPNAETGFRATRKGLPVGGGKAKEFAYTSNATDAIDFVMDVNGKDGPNAEADKGGKYYDIRSFKIASFSEGSSCEEKGGFIVEDMCVVDIGTNYKYLDCTQAKNADYCTFKNTAIDYWAGGKKACHDIGMSMPDKDHGNALVSHSNGQLSGFYYTTSHYAGLVWLTSNSRVDAGSKQNVFCYK